MRICNKSGGGLGNRVLGSITAYYFANLLGRKLHIGWPEGIPACLADWKDLFENTSTICQDIVPENFDDYYIVHNTEFFKDKKHVMCHRGNAPLQQEKIIEQLTDILTESTANGKDIIIQDDGAYVNELPMELLSKFFREGLRIKQHILDRASKFCYLNNITKDTLGVHLRLTDMIHYGLAIRRQIPSGNEVDMKNYILGQYVDELNKIVKDFPEKRFFVCSDDPKAENRLKDLFGDKIITFDKSQYVEKFHPTEGWDRRDTTGEDLCSYNVSRSKDSVIEALIDCLILSRTNSGHFPRVGSFNILGQMLSLVDF
jgi:hypothetical protein